MAKKNYTIAIIEDDKLVSDTVSDVLSESYTKVHVYNDSKKALDEIGSLAPDLLLLDIFLGHANGLDILETLRNEGFKMPVIMMTAFSDSRRLYRKAIGFRAVRTQCSKSVRKPRSKTKS